MTLFCGHLISDVVMHLGTNDAMAPDHQCVGISRGEEFSGIPGLSRPSEGVRSTLRCDIQSENKSMT